MQDSVPLSEGHPEPADLHWSNPKGSAAGDPLHPRCHKAVVSLTLIWSGHLCSIIIPADKRNAACQLHSELLTSTAVLYLQAELVNM